MQRLQDIGPPADPLTPSDVEDGATVVYPLGAAWAVGLSTQFRRRIRHGTRLKLDPQYVSTHFRNSEATWATVAGDGYCGYETLRQQLEPSAPRFLISDPRLRLAMKVFLTKILSWLPQETPTAVTRRIKEAVIHLDGPDPLPRRAWCHMDLIEHFSVTNHLPLWTVARTPIQSPLWLGQMHKTTPNPVISSNGIAYNGIDHFATFSPGITPEQRALAHLVLELALNNEDLPTGWCCVRGKRRGNIIGNNQLQAPLTSTSSSKDFAMGPSTLPIVLEDLTPHPTLQTNGENYIAPSAHGIDPQPAPLLDSEWQVVPHVRRTVTRGMPTLGVGKFNIFDKTQWGSIPQQSLKPKQKKTALKKPSIPMAAQINNTVLAARTRPQRVPAMSYISQLEIDLTPERKYMPQTPPLLHGTHSMTPQRCATPCLSLHPDLVMDWKGSSQSMIFPWTSHDRAFYVNSDLKRVTLGRSGPITWSISDQ
jgi:hypothetical protein